MDSELCLQCAQKQRGTDARGDFAGATTPEEAALRMFAIVPCTGCGSTFVDEHGACVFADCGEKHGSIARPIASLLAGVRRHWAAGRSQIT